MQQNTKTRKIISILVSAIMVISMCPLMAFTSFAEGEATSPVYNSGDWLVPGASWNGNMNGFSNNGAQPAYSTIGLHSTNFVFMQTEDNQLMTYTVNMYGKKNAITNSAKIMWLNTNYNNSADDFMALVTSEYWYSNGSNLSRWQNGSTFPQDVDMTSYGTPGLMQYTVQFTANGSAVYHPEWTMEVRTRSSSFGGYSNYQMYALNYDGSVINADPVFTIQVIDLRELKTLVSMAGDLNIDVSDIVASRDLSGATYYSQSEVDTMVAALRARLLCDYTALDTQLARAAQIETTNIEGALGGKLYDELLYNIFTEVYEESQSFDRFLMGNAESQNQADINNQAYSLQQAIDNLLVSRNALVNYYVDDVLYAQNTVSLSNPSLIYNLHDATDKFIADPTKQHYQFIGWADENGNLLREDTEITADLNVYAKFTVKLNGVAPLSSNGRWDHIRGNTTNPDGDYYMWGENYVTMWVSDTNFNFMQVHDDQVFSFYTDFTAVKNQGSNYARINDVWLLDDAATNEFSALLDGDNGVEIYCVTPNFGNGDRPSEQDLNGNGEPDGLLPGIAMNNHASQMSAYFVTWRYIYAFNANGNATYNPKWNIEYVSGGQNLLGDIGNTEYHLTDSGDTYVNFTINVSDARELIKAIDKAESILNNTNNGFDEATKAALRAVLNDINDNYTLDGSVYYDQTTINTQIERIKAYIPDSLVVACDYTGLDAAIAAANAYDREHGNDNNHYIDEAWDNFLSAYDAAVNVDRTLTVDDDNVNQTMINGITDRLNFAMKELTYLTHVNEHADDTALQDLVDEATDTIGTDNSNGKYDDDAWQDYIDALEHAQDVIDQDLYIDSDGNNDNQQTIDDALQALEDAIAALNDSANQNNACDYSALDEAIAATQSINNSDLFTPETYQALQDALTAGQAVDRDLYDNGTNQQIIDDAAQAINDAIANLLTDAIDNSENVDTTGMTSDSVTALDNAVNNAQTVANDSTSTAQDKADAIEGIQDAVDGLTPDKTELEEAITAGEGIDTTDIPQNLADALEDALDNGNTVDADSDATVQEIKDATDAINDAIDDILEHVINEAENTDTTGMTDESIQDLQDAIDHANDVLNDPDATAQDKADAIAEVQDAIGDLTEVNKFIPTVDGGLVVDRTDTEYYYLVGLDANDTTFTNVKTLFENDGRQIIAFRNGVQLSESDHIGTGCIIKCVSIKDPSIVYEQATVILYGDVNGDGLVNNTDYDALFNETLFGTAIEGDLFRIAGDLNNDEVIDGFDMSKLDLQITGERPFDQTVEYYK